MQDYVLVVAQAVDTMVYKEIHMSTKTQTAKKKTVAKPVSQAILGLKGKGLLQVGRGQKLELRDRLRMPQQTFGKIVNVAERTIAKIEAGEDGVEKLKRPYNEVYRLCEALAEVVDPECLGEWFQTPNDSFDGLKPIEVIQQGEIDQLWNMVFELQSGMPG